MDMRRRMLRTLAAAGAFGPAGLLGVVRDAMAMGRVPVAPGLHRVVGEVRVNGEPAAVGQPIRPGDTVATGARSEAVYVIGQDAFLQRDQSTIVFGAETAKTLFRVITGKILSVLGKRAVGRDVETATATIGIRGTGFYIEDEGQGAAAHTYFCLCYGEVELTPTAAPQERETYLTTHHDKPMVIYNDMAMPKMMAPASVMNHTDAELTLLESLVGRWPPFNGRSRSRY
jgi:hypothetical protein